MPSEGSCGPTGARAFRPIPAPAGFPPPVGPYSPAVEAGGWVFLSGQIALTPEGTLISGGAEAQARLVFERLGTLLASAGCQPAHVVKLVIYLTEMGDFPVVNAACARFFSEPYPARVTVGVASLPKGALLEIDATCYKPS